MWWMTGNEFPGWWMMIGLLWMAVFWGGIIFLVVWGIRTLTNRGGQASPPDPLTVLKERYARGEITREQYEQIRADIER